MSAAEALMHEANSDDDRPSGDKKPRSIIDAESRRQKPPKSFDLPKDLPKDPIEIVDLFETQNAVVEAVQTQSLLNQDDHLDYKKELLKFDDFEDLFRHIESPKEKYFGEVSCTGLFGSYYFVGNSNGYIRVFDLKSELVRDLKPLYDKQLAKKRVMCIDFSLGMEYLVAGYENGSMALFDLQTYKLVKVISDVHETPVLAAKIYLINKVKSSVSFLSMEQSGQVTRTKINTKDFFKKSTKDGLYDKRFKHPRTIAVQHIDDRFVKSKWATRGLVAVGATSEVVVCQMNPLTEIYKLKRPP
jgi:WD40 repeat protein